MTWGRIDDQLWQNEKQLAMSSDAFRLWICSISYCCSERDPTGFLSTVRAKSIASTIGIASKRVTPVIGELVGLHAWEPCGSGWLIHDFDIYVDRGSRDRVRAHRARKRAEAESKSNADVTLQKQESNVPCNEGRNGAGNATSSRARRARTGIPVPEPGSQGTGVVVTPESKESLTPQKALPSRVPARARESEAPEASGAQPQTPDTGAGLLSDDTPRDGPEPERGRPLVLSEHPVVVALTRAWQQHNLPPLSGVDRQALLRIPETCPRVSPTQAAAVVDSVAGDLERKGDPLRRFTLVHRELEKLEHDLSDLGVRRPREAAPGEILRLVQDHAQRMAMEHPRRAAK